MLSDELVKRNFSSSNGAQKIAGKKGERGKMWSYLELSASVIFPKNLTSITSIDGSTDTQNHWNKTWRCSSPFCTRLRSCETRSEIVFMSSTDGLLGLRGTTCFGFSINQRQPEPPTSGDWRLKTISGSERQSCWKTTFFAQQV